MLSKSTVKFLNSACEKSNQKYDQGGLIYLYTYGYRRAHSFINYEVLKSVNGNRNFDAKETQKIILFFASAIEHPYPESIEKSTVKFTEEFISMLYKDFEIMYAFISDYEEDDTSKILTITFLKDNDFHSLELFWSID